MYNLGHDIVKCMWELKQPCNRYENKYEETKELVSYIDVLVDGKFEIDKKNFKLKFRGSSNQRIINVKESLKNNKVILMDGYMSY